MHNSNTTTSSYPTKKDAWLWGSIAVSALISLIIPFFLVTEPLNPILKIAIMLLCFGAFGFLVGILFRVRYVLTPTELLIFYPAMNRKILLTDIYEVFPTNNAISSPALSLDRLHIKYRGHRLGVIISPVEKETFVADLLSRCSHLTRRGDKLIETHTPKQVLGDT